jgi:hypothetical protein
MLEPALPANDYPGGRQAALARPSVSSAARASETAAVRPRAAVGQQSFSVTDICFDVGFASLGTFTSREIVGETP